MREVFLAVVASWFAILSSAAHAFDIIQITNNGTSDGNPAISGSNVVWSGHDGVDYEIYMTTIPGPGPGPVPSTSFGGLALLAGLIIGTAGWLIRRQRVASA